MGSAPPPPFPFAATEVQAHPFVPEIRLRLATDAFGLWEESDAAMGRGELAAPFWATAWPGGLGLARFLLDHRAFVFGRTVIDVATGSGVVAIAAALAGAASVAAYDTDELAVRAAQMNARLNGVDIDVTRADVREVAAGSGVLVTAGDVFYDRTISTAMLSALGALAAGGAEVLIGDPYRNFLPEDRLESVATLAVDVDMFLESDPVKPTLIARFS
jgi:predicted nicotinamide N-methyase